nr:cobalamin biosynthesis protein [uncultured Anaeromusa sp.]
MKLAFFAVTAKGAKLAVTLAQVLPAAQVDVYAKHAESKEREVCLPLDSLAETVKLRFADCDGLVFFMALGIVVRMVGPLLVDKRQDPAVVAVDDGGHFAISVLSGHIGGANELTQQVAEAIDAVPVITTATDVSGAVAADVLAVKLGLKLEPFGQMKYINAALAAGKPVAFLLDETLPRATTWRERAAELGVDFQPLSAWQGGEECLVILSDRWQPALAAHMAHVLYLRPPSLLLGMGCRKGASVEVVAQAAQEALAAKGYSAASVASLGSAWVKLEEAGLQALAAAWQIPFICYEKESLAQAVKDYQLEQSNFVSQQIGVGNVCEAAACLQNQYKQGELVIPKTKRGPVTVAVVRGGLSS